MKPILKHPFELIQDYIDYIIARKYELNDLISYYEFHLHEEYLSKNLDELIECNEKLIEYYEILIKIK